MKKLFYSSTFFLLMFGILNLKSPSPAAGALDFAIIQPGQPGSSEEAKPVMDALASYLQNKLGNGQPVKGIYLNEHSRAVDFLQTSPPQWGIVSLGFYAEHAVRFIMTPLGSTRPGGSDNDIWRLAVGLDAPDDWQTLQGEVQGTMLFERNAATCLIFGAREDKLPFKILGTFHPLQSLRATSRGKMAGVVLDRRQHDAMKTLSVTKKIKVIYASEDLPTSPVVWFGPLNNRSEQLTRILMDMRTDPHADKLLKLLQTRGFGPADQGLPKLRLDGNERCSQ